MSRFLVCGLDDESYANADYTICNTIEDAVDAAAENVKSYLGLDYDPELFLEYDHDKIRCSCKLEGSFYVNVILEIGLEDCYLGILHKAYDGVDFSLMSAGTEDECFRKMRKECRNYARISYQEYENQAIADDGVSYWVWDVIDTNLIKRK